MVISGVNTVTYNGNGSQTAWPFTFPIAAASEIKVQLINEDGTYTAITSDFYVDVVNSTVYYPGYAPGAEPPEAEQPPKVQDGQKIEVYREVPMTQEADLGDKWPFKVIEKGLDKLTMISQQIASGTKRTVDAALASMLQLAGVVVDSDKLQHITDQLNAIDENADAAAESADLAKDWATKADGTVDGNEYSAKKYAQDASASAASAATSATNAGNSALTADSVATALTDIYNDAIDQGTIVAPAVDATLSVSGAAADAKVTGVVSASVNDVFDNVYNNREIGLTASTTTPIRYRMTAGKQYIIKNLSTAGAIIGYTRSTYGGATVEQIGPNSGIAYGAFVYFTPTTSCDYVAIYANGSTANGKVGIYQEDSLYSVKEEIRRLSRLGLNCFLADDFTLGNYNYSTLKPTHTLTYRICTKEPIVYDRPITLAIPTGWRIYFSYVAGGVVTDVGWKTGTWNIPANQEFSCIIGRTTDDTSELLDVEQVATSIGVSTMVVDTNELIFSDNLLTLKVVSESAVNGYGGNVTVASDSDGNYVFNGTPNTSTAASYYDITTFFCKKTGVYLLDGNAVANLAGTKRLRLTVVSTKYRDDGYGAYCYMTAGQTYTIRATMTAGSAALSNAVIKPRLALIDERTNPVVVNFYGNSGGGDSTLVSFADNTHMLIDTMTVGAWSLLNGFLSTKTAHLDYLILTHYHSDHIGNVQNLIDNGYVDGDTIVYLPQALDSTYDQEPYPDATREAWQGILSTESAVKTALTNAGCTMVTPLEGDEIHICNTTFRFVNCDHSYYYGVSDNYNDWSLCCYMFNGDQSVFFTGDLGKIAQNHINNNVCKTVVLKAMHHGWVYLDPQFINAVWPKVVVSENSQAHIDQGLVDSEQAEIQWWCEHNGVPHYMTILSNNNIEMVLDTYNHRYNGNYTAYISGAEHKNWHTGD